MHPVENNQIWLQMQVSDCFLCSLFYHSFDAYTAQYLKEFSTSNNRTKSTIRVDSSSSDDLPPRSQSSYRSQGKQQSSAAVPSKRSYKESALEQVTAESLRYVYVSAMLVYVFHSCVSSI